MDLVQPGTEKPLRFVSSAALIASQDQDHDLLTVAYVRAQKLSPEFTTVFEGIDQSIDIKISTVIFRAAPQPIISLYDFVMTTFASQSKMPTIASEDPHKDEIIVNRHEAAEERIRVLVKLASVQSQPHFIPFYSVADYCFRV
jgi:vacuolar protein sorting-associated protein 13A/C